VLSGLLVQRATCFLKMLFGFSPAAVGLSGLSPAVLTATILGRALPCRVRGEAALGRGEAEGPQDGTLTSRPVLG